MVSMVSMVEGGARLKLGRRRMDITIRYEKCKYHYFY